MIREVFVSDVMTKYRCYSRSTKRVNTMMMMIIGVARYGALGHVLPPWTSNCLIFLVTSELHSTNSDTGFYVVSCTQK